MKLIFKNIMSSFFLKLVFVLFILQFLFDFYWSIKLDSIDTLLSGLLENITTFLVLYALGMLIKEKGSKE